VTARTSLSAFAAICALAASSAAMAQPPILLEEELPEAPESKAPEDAAANGDEGEKADKRNGARRPTMGGRILADARERLKKNGCAAAAPAYRVAAALGKGMETAQHELGDCLLDMAKASDAADVDRELLREEGLLWLARAAHAGNARAQRSLVMLFASPVAGAHDPAAALRWALTYEKNPEADLYGGPLPSTLVDGLRSDIPLEDVAAAEAFAAAFQPRHLPAYTAPAAASRGEQERRSRDRNARRRGPR